MSAKHKHQLLFHRINFIYVGIGLLLIVLGFLAMIGGGSDDPNVYDEEALYGFQRTILAPALILAGFVVQGIAIFKKSPEQHKKEVEA